MITRYQKQCSIMVLGFLMAGCVHQENRLATGKDVGNRPLSDVVSEAADDALKQNNYAEAVGYLALMHHQSPQDEATALRYATALRRTGETDKALAVLKAFSQPENASSAALVANARTLLQANRPADALQNARWAIDSNPKNGDAFDVLGVALNSLNKPDEAEKAYQTALANQTPEPDRTLNNLGLSLARRGRLAEAVKMLEQANQLSRQSPTIQRNLQMARSLLDQQQMQPTYAKSFPSHGADFPPVPADNPARLNAAMAAQYPDRLIAERDNMADRIMLPVSNDPVNNAAISDQLVHLTLAAGVVVDMQSLSQTLSRNIEDIQMMADPKASRLVISLKKGMMAESHKINGRWIVEIQPGVVQQSSSLSQPVMMVEKEGG